jgi:O-antigen/teichoic acid export membrane protein
MSVQDYGAYAAALAVLEITLALSDFGLSWAAWRFVPAYRVAAGSGNLHRLVAGIAAARGLTLIAAGGCLWVLAELLSQKLNIPAGGRVLHVTAVLLFADGAGRFIREILFESLLLQGRTQISQLVRNIVLTVSLGTWLIAGNGELPVEQALWFEVTAAALASVVALVMLVQSMLRDNYPATHGWQPPSTLRFWRLAWPNYLSSVLLYLTGGQAMIAVASSLVGPQGAAALGMCRNLVEQIRRYLPSELLAGLARPPIIAAYETSHDFAQLNRHVRALFKTSYVLLLPIVAIATGLGGLWIDVIAKGKYSDVHLLFVLMVGTLVPLVHRRVLEMVVNTVDSSDIWLKASLVGALALPLAYLLVRLGAPLESMVIAILAGEVATNLLIVAGLKLRGYAYHMATARPLIALLAAVVMGFVTWECLGGALPLLSLALLSCVLFAASLLAAWWVRVFDVEEIEMFQAFWRPSVDAKGAA